MYVVYYRPSIQHEVVQDFKDMSRSMELGIGALVALSVGAVKCSGVTTVEIPDASEGCRAEAISGTNIRGDASTNNDPIGFMTTGSALPILNEVDGQNVDPSRSDGDEWFVLSLDGQNIGYVSSTAVRAIDCANR